MENVKVGHRFSLTEMILHPHGAFYVGSSRFSNYWQEQSDLFEAATKNDLPDGARNTISRVWWDASC